MTPERSPGSGRRGAALRRRLQRCLRLPSRTEEADAPAFSSRSSSVSSSPNKLRPSYSPASPPSLSHSWSDTEVLTPLAVKGNSRSRRRRSADATHSPTALLQSPQSLRAAAHSLSSSSSSSSPSSSSRKGVQYDRDGGLLCCRFCDILRAHDEEFLYEDDEMAVFRPLSPAVESHILVVPRCHIRNVNMLTERDSPLLERMRHVAKLVLREMPFTQRTQRTQSRNSRKKRLHAQTSSSSSGSTSSLPSPVQRGSSGDSDDDVHCKLAFHTPPFNSIDHVHMHAFRTDQQSFFGCVGAIKYRTATWWCRSFDEVMARLDADGGAATHKKSKHPSRHHRHEHHEEQLPCAHQHRRVAPRSGHKSRPHSSVTDAVCALDEEESKDEQELPVLRPQAVI